MRGVEKVYTGFVFLFISSMIILMMGLFTEEILIYGMIALIVLIIGLVLMIDSKLDVIIESSKREK